MVAGARYPNVSLYIDNAMKKAGIFSNAALYEKLRGHIGPEFLRLIVNGEKLPEVDKGKAIARALNVEYVEFLCVIENDRLKDRGVGNLVRVIPAK